MVEREDGDLDAPIQYSPESLLKRTKIIEFLKIIYFIVNGKFITSCWDRGLGCFMTENVCSNQINKFISLKFVIFYLFKPRKHATWVIDIRPTNFNGHT